MSSQKHPRYYYIITMVFLCFFAASLYYLLTQKDNEYYAILVGQYTSYEGAEKDLPVIHNLFDKSDVKYSSIVRYKDYSAIQIGKFKHKAAAEQFKEQISDVKILPESRVSVAHIKNGKIFEVSIDAVKTLPAPKEEIQQQPENIVSEKIEDKPREHAYGLFEYLPEEYISLVTGQSFYTIQLASSTKKDFALKEFDTVVSSFPSNIINWLRVEHVQQFHTIRAGKFQTKQEARPAFEILAQKYPKAQVLKVYIKPERISRIYFSGDDGVAPLVPQPLHVVPDSKEDVHLIEKDIVDKAEMQVSEAVFAQKNIRQEAGEEFYTVQLISSSQLPSALREYDEIEAKMVPENLDNLRVEQINKLFAIRVGKFASRPEAESLKKLFVDTGYKDAFVLSAHIIPSRIRKIFPVIISEVDQKIEIDTDPKTVDVSAGELEEKEEIEIILEEKPEEAQVVEQPPVEVPGGKEVPEKVTFSFEVLTVLEKDDKGENLRMPSALFFDHTADELYVVNGANNRVVVFGSDYFPQNSLGKGRGLDSPLNGTLDGKGNVYVTQAGTPSSPSRITVLNAAFLPEREIFLKGIPGSAGFVFQKNAVSKNGLLYVAGLNSNKVLVLDTSGAFKKWLYVSVDQNKNYVPNDGSSESKTNAEIKDVVIDSLGNLFFLSEEDSKVYVFSSDEKFLFSFGTKGGAAGKMSRPRGLAVDEKKRCFYIVDYMRHTVLVFDFTGAFRFEFGGRGWGPEWFNYPVDIELGAQGEVIVADFFNQRVQIFETSFSAPLPQKPQDLWMPTNQ